MIAQQILTPGDRSVGVGAQQCLISWALMFFILENCDRDQLSPDTAASWTELTGEMLATAVSVAGAQGVSTQVRRENVQENMSNFIIFGILSHQILTFSSYFQSACCSIY